MAVPRHTCHTGHSRPARAPRSRALRGVRYAALPAGVLMLVTACGGSGGGQAASTPSSRPPASTSASTPSPSASRSLPGTTPPRPGGQALACVDRVMNAMTERQKVGQLFMSAVTASGATSSQLRTLRQNDVGSVILMGHTDEGVSGVRQVTDQVQGTAPTVGGSKVGLMVSTDQEGGQVQVLNGPGFSQIPPATTQGRWPTARLQQQAAVWGRQLRSAGVGVDLAPVADIVPPDLRQINQPIGRLEREYGNDAQTAARQSTAVVRGFGQAGVYATLKHFPSLGSVRGNTDFSADVTDDVTVRDGSYQVPYRSGIDAGARFVMASLATYTRIDPAHQSVFSPTLLKDELRGTLGFKGVVISDDMGKAIAVRALPPGERATRFLAAGGDMVLTVAPDTVAPMTSAVLARTGQDSGFRAGVDASVKRVLEAKLDSGLLGGCSA